MEFLNAFCNWHLRHHWKRHQNWKGFVFVVLDEVSSLDHQFPAANPFHQLAHVLDDSFINNHFHLYGTSANCLPAGSPHGLRVQGDGVRPIGEYWLILHGVD